MIAPKGQSTDSVMAWLKAEGLTASISPRLNAVVVEASVSRIEKLLDTKYEVFSEHLSISNLSRGYRLTFSQSRLNPNRQ